MGFPIEFKNIHTLILHNLSRIEKIPVEFKNINTLKLCNLQHLKELPPELYGIKKLIIKNCIYFLRKYKKSPVIFEN